MNKKAKIIKDWILKHQQDIIDDFSSILKISALAPDFEGEGELKKCEHIESLLSKWGFQYKRINVPDERVQSGCRPSLIIEYNLMNLSVPALVIVCHMDVVPTGNENLWTSPPFDPQIRNGNLYARGSEDNGQGLIASLYALRCIKDLDITSTRPIKVVIVADEETGSKYGIQPLLEQGHFSSDELVLIPDGGIKSGLQIQIAEKAGIWVKITVKGEQGHAARPEDALNAHRITNRLAVLLDDLLHDKFKEENELFQSSVSTFEPTKRIVPIENVNTLPGIDELYWDCRLIPEHPPEKVKNFIKETCKNFAAKMQCEINVDFIAESPKNPPHTEDLPIITKFSAILEQIFMKKPFLVGLGGGSCAAHFRSAGIPAIVWGHMDHVAHAIDEYCVLDFLWDDIFIYVNLMRNC